MKMAEPPLDRAERHPNTLAVNNAAMPTASAIVLVKRPLTNNFDGRQPSRAHSTMAATVQRARFLRAHHRKMLALADESGYYNFYVARLFHLPSNYWMNEKFNTMNIKKIKHYRLLTRSICYKVVDGHLVEHVVKEDAVVFDVGQ